MTIREQMQELSEPRYRKFTSAPMPGVENVLGNRISQLRKIARGDWRQYSHLNSNPLSNDEHETRL